MKFCKGIPIPVTEIILHTVLNCPFSLLFQFIALFSPSIQFGYFESGLNTYKMLFKNCIKLAGHGIASLILTFRRQRREHFWFQGQPCYTFRYKVKKQKQKYTRNLKTLNIIIMMMKIFIVSRVVSNMNRTVFNRTFSTSRLMELFITQKT